MISVNVNEEEIKNVRKRHNFTEEDINRMSKYRIIQKNLVHVFGIPDELFNIDLLILPEYFGQYGNITKIVLATKNDKFNNVHNSAYITYMTKEQASYAILAVDSIKISGKLVRAFFGTSKYCNHFLNNSECINEENCIFLHHIAKKKDIISEIDKFGYTEHIMLAKKIIGFQSYRSKTYVKNNKYPYETFLPNIETIYSKENILMKSNNHKRNTSNNSIINNSYSSENFENKFSLRFDSFLNNDEANQIFESKNKSRFFDNNNNNDNETNEDNIFLNYKIIINNILSKFPLYYQKSDEYIKNYEFDYCLNLYKKTNDIEILNLLKNIF